MSNFSTKLKDIPDEELESLINEHDPRFGILESNELMRRSVNKVWGAIKDFNKQSSKQTKKMIILTWVIVFLTIVMIIGLLVQIVLK